jgi:hypothetical protein
LTLSYRADGSGFYDIKFSFSNKNSSGVRFGGSQTVSFNIRGSTLDEGWNLTPSEFPGDAGTYDAAAHVGATGTDAEGSGWIGAVPEPSVAVLSLLASGLLLTRRRPGQPG